MLDMKLNRQLTSETFCQAKKLLETHLAAFGYRSQDLALSTGSGGGCSLLVESTGSRDLSFGYRSRDLALSAGFRDVAVSTRIGRSSGGGGCSPPERGRGGKVEGWSAREIGDETSRFFSSGSCSGATTQKMMIRKVEEHGEGGGGDGVLALEEEADASEGGEGVNALEVHGKEATVSEGGENVNAVHGKEADVFEGGQGVNAVRVEEADVSDGGQGVDASVCSSGCCSPSGKGEREEERGEEREEERGEERRGLTRATTKKMMICKVGRQREGGAVEGGGGGGGGVGVVGRGGGVNASEKVCATCGQAFSSFFAHQCLK